MIAQDPVTRIARENVTRSERNVNPISILKSKRNQSMVSSIINHGSEACNSDSKTRNQNLLNLIRFLGLLSQSLLHNETLNYQGLWLSSFIHLVV